MPSQRQSTTSQRQSRGRLQSQGVPIPDRLHGPQRRTTTRYQQVRRTPIEGEMGGTQTETFTQIETPEQRQARRQRPTRPIRDYSPTRVGEKAGASVGLLEAEFFGILFLLFAQMFVGSASYGDKIMSFMKRGTLSIILFFFLALIASVGDNAAKVAKGLGALVFVSILISSPSQDIINGLDAFFKQDWIGTSESGIAASASADSGTSASQNTALGAAESALGAAFENLGAGYAGTRVLAGLATGNLTAAKNGLASLGSKVKSEATDILGSFGIHL